MKNKKYTEQEVREISKNFFNMISGEKDTSKTKNKNDYLKYIREKIYDLMLNYKETVLLQPLIDLYNEIGLMINGLWEE